VTEPARPGRRRPSANEVEEWAFGLLERHLVDTKHVVANVRRPDRTNRTSRDVDFLVEVDGRDIAIGDPTRPGPRLMEPRGSA
jgi:hypothetical protein